ncbi:MAG: sigma-70 family RNA polymerase sigma factor [Flavobacteriaceae bacterium]|nr:MAG: sigma-70 family RNA polymerase sigma factor [Flavobacteriaceae bacterium]
MTTQEVWTTYANDIKYFIISKVKDKAIADDIVQDTFLKIHTKLHTLKNINKLKAWIFTIARNTVIDYFKKSNQTFETYLLKSETEIEQDYHTEKDCLRGILKGLPKKYRDPLFLSDIKGMRQSEVAKQLKLSVPAAKSQIQRARKLIAQGFINCCGFTLNDQGYLVGEMQEKANCKICK